MNNKVTYITLITCTAFIAVLLGYGYYNITSNEPQAQKGARYIEKISGFETDTKIEIIYSSFDNKTHKENIIINENKIIILNSPNIKNIKEISYRVQKPNNTFIDVEASSNKIQFNINISGLEKDSAVNIGNNEGVNNTFIPVDWAGRIALEISQNPNNAGFCLSFKENTNNMMICHNIKTQVAS